MSTIIAVPTGVKVFNWMFTMYGGRVRYDVPMYWAIAFIITFIIAGLTGVLLAVPPADFVLHNSLFVVAHFHNVIIGAILFGMFAGYTYWFPKVFGFRLDERLGKAAFWCWFVGFYLAFGPLYVVGLMGMTRRMQHYDNPAWYPWLLVAMVGAVVILAGILFQVAQLVVSIRNRERAARYDRRSVGRPGARMVDVVPAARLQLRRFASCRGDGRLLVDEAARASSAGRRSRNPSTRTSRCRGTAPPASSAPSSLRSWASRLIWQIWWLAALAFIGAFATFVVFAWRDRTEYRIPAAEVARIDRENRAARRLALAQMEPAE